MKMMMNTTEKDYQMKTTEYLYGKDISNFPDAKEHYQAKIEASKLLLKELVNAPYEQRDEQRIRDVTQAIKFNERLLNEYSE